jgi:hypothetical protein
MVVPVATGDPAVQVRVLWNLSGVSTACAGAEFTDSIPFESTALTT